MHEKYVKHHRIKQQTKPTFGKDIVSAFLSKVLSTNSYIKSYESDSSILWNHQIEIILICQFFIRLPIYI